MSITQEMAILANTKENLRLALGLDTNVPFSDYVEHLNTEWSPSELFSEGQQGFWYEPNDISTLFQNIAGTIPVLGNNDPVGKILDKSGNNNHAVQGISSRRMLYKRSPPRLYLDKVDDEFMIAIPAGGWIGTMVVATNIGTASYEVNLPSGNYSLGGRNYISNEIIGILFRNGTLSSEEKVVVEQYFVNKGAVESFINTANISSSWRDFRTLVKFPFIETSNTVSFSMAWNTCLLMEEFPLIDTSKANAFYFTWSGCAALKEFPQINTSNSSDFAYGWNGCSSLESFPFLDTSKGTRFFLAWSGCRSLTNFPAGFFDNIKGGDFSSAFSNTNLNQESIDNVLTSLVTSGVETGTRKFDQSGGSEPSQVGKQAIDILRSRGWLITVTGGY